MPLMPQALDDFERSATKIVRTEPETCALFDFIRSGRYRRRVSAETLRLISMWTVGDSAFDEAASKLPTRQIANALAGVPELAWRTSLDRCQKTHCWHWVAPATEKFYKIVRGPVTE